MNLNGWSVQYKSSVSGSNSEQWEKLDLTGWIGSEDYYLIRCGAVTNTENVKYNVPEGNQEWEDLLIYNKGFSVVLRNNTELLDENFAGDISERTDYIDCLAAQGNDGNGDQVPLAYEKEYSPIQSKKKSVMRKAFADSDNNSTDVTTVDYSKSVDAANGPHKGTYGGKKTQIITLAPSVGGSALCFSEDGSLGLIPGDVISLGASAETHLTYESSNEAVLSVSADGAVAANKAGKAQIVIRAEEDGTYAAATTTVNIVVSQGFTLKTDGFENGNSVALNKLGSYISGISNPDGGVAEIVSYDKSNNNAWVVNGATGMLDIISLVPVTCNTGTALTATSIDIRNLVETTDNGFSYGDMTSVSVNSDLGIVAVALQDSDYRKDGRVAVLDLNGRLLALLPSGCQPDMVTFTPDGTKILTANEGESREGDPGNPDADPKGSVTIITLNMENIEASSSVNVTFDSFDVQREQLIVNNIILSKDAVPSLDLEPEYIAADNTKAYIALQEANAIAVLNLKTAQYEGIYSLGFKDLCDSKNAVDINDEDGIYKADTYKDTLAAYMPDGIALYQTNGRTYLLTANEGDAREWGDYSNEAKQTLETTSGETVKKVRVIDSSVTDGLPEGKSVMFGGRSFSIYEMTEGGMNQIYESANDFEAKTAECLPSYFNASNDDNDFDSRSKKKGPEPEGLYFIDSASSPSGTPILLAAFEVSGTVAAYSVGSEPAGHTSSGMIKYDAETHWYECKGCGIRMNEEEHKDADRDGVCDICGLKLKEQENQTPEEDNKENPENQIQGTDKNNTTLKQTQRSGNTPKTGDDSDMVLWVSVMGIAVIGAGTVLIIFRRKKYR